MRFFGRPHPGPGDLCTLGNALCGVAAILFVASHRWSDSAARVEDLRPAVFLLLAGTVLDVVDGTIARRFGSTDLGRPLDAMADLVTFGVAAPLLLAVPASARADGGLQLLVAAGALVYAGGALLRLAQFSAVAERADRFTGLPSTMAAVIVVDLVFLSTQPVFAAAGLAVLGYLMISPLHYPVQGAAVAVLAVAGWVVGVVALLGVIDVRPPAVASLVVILVVVPLCFARRSNALVPGGGPRC